jgi:DNA-binding CsgD family transcriptional regulator
LAAARTEGRDAFARRDWAAAFLLLSSLPDPDHGDLECLATAAYLTGHDAQAIAALLRAHRAALRDGDLRVAARHAFWLGLHLLLRGQTTHGGGWLARAGRLLESFPDEGVERGYLLVPAGLMALGEGDSVVANASFERAIVIGERHRDHDLLAMARLGLGQSAIRQGRYAEGMRLLDEAMVSVTADEVSSVVSGIVYCAVIEACNAVYDMRRAREWTLALNDWCDGQPSLVPYRGQCLVHRAEILRRAGSWGDAFDMASHARDRLERPAGQPALGDALYEIGEMHRLRGEFSNAEDAYQQSSAWLGEPQPGLALLRLAQGRVDVAAAAIRRLVRATSDDIARCKLLAPFVEIMLAVSDVAAARVGVEELRRIASEMGSPWLAAIARHMHGSVLLAEGDGPTAMSELRAAWLAWRDLGARYEAARARIDLGLTCQALDDHDSAALEFEAARDAFTQLGAGPDAHRAERLRDASRARQARGDLTARESQVLRLVATGRTNRAIAAELHISEKTVDRHVSNIFAKLGVASRAAATAHAYERHLL